MKTTLEMGTFYPAVQVGVLLWKAGLFSEALALYMADMDPDSPDAQKYMGRAAPPVVKVKPLKQPGRFEDKNLCYAPAGYSRRLRFVNSIAVFADKIKKLPLAALEKCRGEAMCSSRRRRDANATGNARPSSCANGARVRKWPLPRAPRATMRFAGLIEGHR